VSDSPRPDDFTWLDSGGRVSRDGQRPAVPSGDVLWGNDLSQTFVRESNRPAPPAGDPPGQDGETLSPPGSDDGSADAPDPARPGRFRLEAYIDQGGVGTVYRAWDVTLRRWVAVKVLQPQHRMSASVRRRFQREGRLTARLRHHGIPSIHEIGTSPDGLPFIAMQLVDGRTLETILHERTDRTADLTRLLTVLLQVAQAIAHAHSQGVIHRDLKPANIMVGEFGVVVVLDWGLAKVIDAADPPDPSDPPDAADPDPRETQQGAVFGTPAYLPPEQARGEVARVDRRADVFGLGAILCEILTGEPPDPGATERSMLKRAMTADLKDARDRLDACDGPLDLIQLAEKCLNADPGDRYASAADVAEVIAGYLQSEQRRAERRLAQFFDLTLDLLCIADMNGYFREINGNFHAVLGHSEEELTTRPFLAFVHPDDADRTVRECERLAVGESSVLFENRYRHKDGHFIHLEWSARAVPGERLIYAVARDVTTRHAKAEADRRAEEDRRHLVAVVDSAAESIVRLNLDGTVAGWNLGAERLFGYTRGEMIGRPVRALVPPGREDDQRDVLDRVRHGRSAETTETIRRRKDGTHIPVCVTVTAVTDAAGTVTGIAKVIRDISDRTHAAAAAAECQKAAGFYAAAAAVLVRGADLKDTLRRFAALAVERLGVASARVWTVDETEETLVLQASSGLGSHPAGVGGHARIPFGGCAVGRIAQERTPSHAAGAGESDWMREEGLVAFVGFPLVVGDRLLGVNAVFAREPLSANVVEAVGAASHALALALDAHRAGGR